MAKVLGSLIQVMLECSECGHQWDIEDYSECHVDAAEMGAEDEPCPKCDES